MIGHDSNAHREDTRGPDEIEHDLDRTRAEVSSTLDAIQSKLTPGQMMDQAFAYARTSLPADFGANLSNTVRNNPLPVTLVGVGIAWLMASSQRSDRYDDSRFQEESGFRSRTGESSEGKVERAASAVNEKGRALKDRASATTHNIIDKTSELGHRLSDSASSVTHQVGELGHRSQEQYYRAKDGIGRMMEEQPLVVGALGIAVGTLLGAMLPATRREDEVMGRTRDDMLEKAKSVASEQAGRVKESARHVAQVAGNEAKAVADDISSGAQRSREEARTSSATAPGNTPSDQMPGQHGYH